ncbi:pyruvate kinase [Roseivirga sp. BDSF3-8]|uniref:pyruvate kinase n=1 Tax=Roseivirga sp. BDSF3-8 TaxID=3241598 RepID=UPI003531C65E
MATSNLQNRTKIVATVGPACNTKEKLKELILAGADVFRLNFSHGSHDDHRAVITLIRELNAEMGTSVCILQDLQGPKIRTREVEGGEVHIETGQELLITTEPVTGNSQRISTNYQALPDDVQPGDNILIDDGKIELEVLEIDGREIKTKVIFGGPVKSRKGINLPKTRVSAPSLTEKDEKDLEFGLSMDVDWVALSFVRKAEDIQVLKQKIYEKGKTINVIAKIEKPEALNNIDEIIDATDGLMVARGDLGVEIVYEDVPMAQKMIVSKAKMKGRPVIVATQMMESMIENPRPTRAETSDVANAVMDGADAVMLSAETAAGSFPVETVKSMCRTISSIENSPESADVIFNKFDNTESDSILFLHDSLVVTACKLSDETDAKAILGLTKSGYTAMRLSMHRPKARIYMFTDDDRLLTRLNLVWGVRCYKYSGKEAVDETLKHVEEILCSKGLLESKDVYITTAAMPLHYEGRTNMLKINVVSK